MKILAMDTSGMPASVAVVQDGYLLAEYTVNYKKTHSQTLLPMLDEIARMTELDLSSLDAIAVAGGPGSFTGLRIGSATAKGLGLALDKPLVSIPTLEGLAYNLFGTNRLICPMMDARREQVFTGIYEFAGSQLQTLLGQTAVPVEEIAERLNMLRREVILLGDGAQVYRERLAGLLTVSYLEAPPHVNRQRASSLAALAIEYIRQGRTQSAAEHHPDYLRVSQAERERAKRLALGQRESGAFSSGTEEKKQAEVMIEENRGTASGQGVWNESEKDKGDLP